MKRHNSFTNVISIFIIISLLNSITGCMKPKREYIGKESRKIDTKEVIEKKFVDHKQSDYHFGTINIIKNKINIPIYRNDYKITKKYIKKTYEDTYNTYEKYKIKQVPTTGLRILTATGAIMTLVGLIMPTIENNDETDEGGDDNSSIYFGLLGGGLAITAISGIIALAHTGFGENEDYEEKLIDSKVQNRSKRYKEWEEDPTYTNKQLINRNVPANYTNVTVNGSDVLLKFDERYTGYSFKSEADAQGILNLTIVDYSSNWYMDKKSALDNINNNNLFEDINPEYRSEFTALAKELIVPKTLTISLETNESSTEMIKVVNDRKKIEIEGYTYNKGHLYKMVDKFVDREINRKIGDVKITLKDYDTHIEISGAKFEGYISRISKTDIAKRYFKGDLVDYAADQIGDFTVGIVKENFYSNGEISFKVYTPCEIEFEITHPDYNYANKTIKFDGAWQSKTIYMSELGKKVRVKIVDE